MCKVVDYIFTAVGALIQDYISTNHSTSKSLVGFERVADEVRSVSELLYDHGNAGQAAELNGHTTAKIKTRSEIELVY